MLLARHNALEFAVTRGRPVVRRYVVLGCVMQAGKVVRAELADEPAETRRLPLVREEALACVHTHFEDLPAETIRAIVAKLTRPTGTRVARITGPLG